MMSDLSEFHDELRSVARNLLAKAGEDEAVDWGTIAASGWPGLEVPSEFGGADATFAETAVVLEEVGRAAARGPYPTAAALGVGALGLLEPGPGRDALLRDTAAGETVPVLVFDGESPEPTPFRITSEAGEQVLDGTAGFVADATSAARLLVPALDPEGIPVIVDLGAHMPGLTVIGQPVLDTTRTFGSVHADGIRVSPGSVWRFRHDPSGAVRQVSGRAAVAVACDSLGLSEAMLDATVRYCGVREQFGRKIGSFQAVKHACADMLVTVTVGRKLVDGAVRRIAAGDPEAHVAAAMAKSYVCGAAVGIAGKAMQLHGGIGYTWESGIHVYLKRATLNRSLYGSPAAHRASLSRRYSAPTG